jgi:hypothetical protein
MRSFSIAVALLVAGPACAQSAMPAVLKCRLVGYGGCSEQGICVGGGNADPSVRMTIDMRKRTIRINNLEGRILGADPLDAPGSRDIHWRWSLIGATKLSLLRTGGGIFVSLGGNGTVTEYRCKRG